MSEDLPDPESRVRVDGSKVVLQWKRTNMGAHEKLIATMKERFRAAGFPIVLTRPFDRRTPSHQCGTVRFGTDPATSALDTWCRAHRSSQSLRRRCRLPADLGRRQPGAHHRRPGAAHRRPYDRHRLRSLKPGPPPQKE